ncbi:sensor histidine kinase [Insolitispirillum peregrinum]|uniref:histidine kinase n=1 Tax=Insolitispirillum peregrinum TaxID=80876 RepID=A0A1N7L2E3_9PROT|nr:HAMP domain-containing histidine kinase [Insolitispirillum peregrinum]SIS67820.1 signal transduction histidine kinase [Insolitispirillum peregrinum]
MKAGPSLLHRIVLRLSLTTAAAILCAYSWLWFEFQSSISSLREQSLIESARLLAESVHHDEGQWRLALPAHLLAPYRRAEQPYGYAIRDQVNGAILLHEGADVGPVPHLRPEDEDEDGVLYTFPAPDSGDGEMLGEYLTFTAAGHALGVQVVRPLARESDLIDTVLLDFFEDGGWLAAPFLIALLAVSILTIRGTLKPLRDISQQAERIGPTAPGVRLCATAVPHEVQPLVQAVNDALDRLEEGYRVQRDFTADAAHELRTPLAVLIAHIDTLPDRQTARELRRDLDGMAHLVEQLLRVARSEALVIQPDEQADLAEVARGVAEYLALVAIRAGRLIEVEAPDQPVRVRGQADALFHAVRNLVENGLRHTPAGTAVVITVEARPPLIRVRDHGPGIPDERKELVFQRFWRADRQTPGSGLGLAIVRRTMEAHGGQVRVQDAPGGGAEFCLHFVP